jgi:hypothetical protein
MDSLLVERVSDLDWVHRGPPCGELTIGNIAGGGHDRATAR